MNDSCTWACAVTVDRYGTFIPIPEVTVAAYLFISGNPIFLVGEGDEL